METGPVLIGIEGLELTAESRELLDHPLVGGAVLFSRNFESRAQLEQLVREIRDLRSPRLLLAVDQEGGRVQRFREGFTRLPALGRIGELFGDRPAKAAEYAYWHGRTMATEMLDVGLDLSFAPVLDLARGSEVIGDRSFSDNPEVVTALGRAYIAGMHAAGMKTTGKHFPGHGSVKLDSHVADVCDDRPLAEIECADLKPFEQLAAELDAVMIAHVVYPCLDDRPAGYAPAWLSGYLRGHIGFEGVIFSDDLGMRAAHIAGGLAERAQAALTAGCDAVLVCHLADVAQLLSAPGGLSVADTSPRISGLRAVATVTGTTEGESMRLWRKRLEQLN